MSRNYGPWAHPPRPRRAQLVKAWIAAIALAFIALMLVLEIHEQAMSPHPDCFTHAC